jgi:RHS repeat-associated protein
MKKGFWHFILFLMLLCVGVRVQAGTVTYIYTDPQGTPLAEAGADGSISATFDYRPYGKVSLGSAPNGPGYTGHVSDPGTDFVYMQQRYYDPLLGRFLSVDPVGMADVEDGRHFNKYTYAYNNPYAFTDPDGRCPACVIVFVGISLFTTTDNANAPGPSDKPASMSRVDQASAVINALPAGRLANGIRMAVKVGRQGQKTYTTYTRAKTDGTVYSGRTSGKADAGKQVSSRTSQPDHQAKTKEGYGPAVVDKNSSNSDAIRGREQELIQQNGGAQSQGGTSGNVINGVSPNNSNKPIYEQACAKEFGC